MWEDFNDANFSNIPWMSCGDFNCITNSLEKGGGTPFNVNSFIMKFKCFVNTHGLIDLGYEGSPYTWTNNQEGC